MSALNKNVRNVYSSLENIQNRQISLDTKNFKSELSQVEKQYKNTIKTINEDSKKLFSKFNLTPDQKTRLTTAIDTGDLSQVQKVYKSIVDSQSRQIKKQQDLVNNLKEQYVWEKKIGALKTGEDSATSLISSAASFTDKRTKGFRADETRLKGPKGGYTNKISDSGYKLIAETYKKIIANEKELKSGTAGQDIFKKLSDTLKNDFNIQLKQSDELIKAITTDYKKIQSLKINPENAVSVRPETAKLKSMTQSHTELTSSRKTIGKLTEDRQSARQTYEKETQNVSKKYSDRTKRQDEYNKELKESLILYEKIAAQEKVNIQEAEEYANTQNELNSSFENIKSYLAYSLSVGAFLTQLKTAINETWEETKRLDEAFASIAMVTDYSVEQMWQSYSQYNDMARELGQSTENVIKSSALFYQQGSKPIINMV